MLPRKRAINTLAYLRNYDIIDLIYPISLIPKERNMRKKIVIIFSVLALALLLVTPALAITDGGPDGEEHPYVGLMVADDANGNPLWRCSGTLISPTLFLTASL